ncbi:MAG: RNA methyltransferase [Lachnospiraceae bacterium]|nr:RNA methyltransferase [Lachnospiraceae bacterium]
MITSISNPQVKHLVQLQKKSKLRNEENVFIVEGTRMFCEVPRNKIQKVYISESLFNRKKPELDFTGLEYEIVTDNVFAYISDTKTPQGILCVLEQSQYTIETIVNGLEVNLLVLDNLQDPGNVGTIFRTAEGAGVTGIVMSKDCVDIYNPKTIRSTMGSVYRMPFIYVEDLSAFMDTLKQHSIHTFAAHLEGTHYYDEADYAGKIAFLIGNEGNGLRDELAQKADTWVRIPMCGEVESLNAAIATAILVYEACRQRR